MIFSQLIRFFFNFKRWSILIIKDKSCHTFYKKTHMYEIKKLKKYCVNDLVLCLL